MNAVNDLRTGLVAFAKRSVEVAGACHNEEATRLYLLLPLIGLLGYDASDPLEVYPNHESDQVGGVVHRADFAILSDGNPVIAFACARAGSDHTQRHGQIAGYFGAWPSTRLGVLTNGLVYEFYVDATTPGTMDAEPFLTIDLETIAASGIEDEVVEALLPATKLLFDSEKIAEHAHIQLVRKRLRTFFIQEAQAPSEGYCRFILKSVGFPNVPRVAIDQHYAAIVKSTFEEALVMPVVQKLKASGPGDLKKAAGRHQVNPRMAQAERELAVFNAIRRRLAFLSNSELEYQAIDRLDYLDYVGKIVVFLDKDPRGRILELIRGAGGGADKFIFPEPFGEILCDNLRQIDEPLRATFALRVKELSTGNASLGLRLARAG
jgi:hypothetical protein